MSKEKPWLHPPHHPNYYEWLLNKKVNKPLRFVASTGSSAVSQVINGRLIVEIPEATKNYQGKVVIDPVHRSGWDIPTAVSVTARAGFERPRPVSKDGNFPNRPISWLMHALGAGAVDRNSPKLRGALKAFGHFLDNDEVVMVFDEGTRIRENARTVHELSSMALTLAAQNGASVIGMGIAGLADEDIKRPLGFGLPTVAVLTEPLDPRYIDGEPVRTSKAVKFYGPVLHNMMQQAQDRAYEIRDEYLK